jgi:hypothetical protein
MAWLGGMIAAELFVAAWLWSEAELANSVPNLQAPYRVIWVIVSLPDFLFLAQHGPLRTASTSAEDIAVISAVYFASTPHTPKRRRRRARARFGLEARQGA